MSRRHAIAVILLGVAGSLSRSRAAEPETPLFGRHVAALFTRLGCNAGACHGAVQGQNGFRLSLFGADPAADHAHLLRDGFGRRLNLLEPDASLLLLKGSGRLSHQGGVRLPAGSREYRQVREWIAAGAKLDRQEQSRVAKLHVVAIADGKDRRLKVEATFADGAKEDVTSLCTFESSSADVATVDAAGLVRIRGVGDAALVSRYRGEPAMTQLFAPRFGKEPFPEAQPVNFIDEHVLKKLRRLNIHPSELCDDATFLRRVSLDVAGAPPTPEEIRAFLGDKAADKRRKKIDALLDSPGYSALWATRFCDILRPAGFDGRRGLTEAAEARRFYEWLRARMRENLPYDQLAERILLSSSLEGRTEQAWVKEVKALCAENAAKTADLRAYAARKTLDLYWQRDAAVGVKGAVQSAHSFLGLRLQCAQCHRHPHDVWQQDDLLSFANFFQRVSRPETPPSPALAKEADALAAEVKELKEKAKQLAEKAKEKGLSKEEMTKRNALAKEASEQIQTLESAIRRVKGSAIHGQAKAGFASVTSTLGKQESKRLRHLGDKEAVESPGDGDPRELFVRWLKKPDNPYFARAIVNRVWAHYYGRGIVDPPDHLSPLNPPTHPELLDALCADFVKHRFDLKHLHRVILNSRTYQQSAKTNATNRNDSANYASSYLRRLAAEVLVDAVNHATGGVETFPPELHLPAGAKALEVPGGAGAASLAYPFHIFGRPSRGADTQCDCERDAKPTIIQTLYLANHPAVQKKIASPTGRVARIIKDIAGDEKRVEEVFLWAVSRPPNAEELRTSLLHLKESPSPERGLQDLLWALLNTREFLLNH